MSDLKQAIVECIPKLRRYARALMRGDVLAADDLVQDCLERALSRLHQWRGDSDPRAWLFTIMHNLYANQVRRITTGPQFVSFPVNDEHMQVNGAAERQLELRDLHRAIANLHPEQREILLLVTLEGFSYHEVAAIVGIPQGTVMSKLSRARNQLRTVLTETETRRLRRIK